MKIFKRPVLIAVIIVLVLVLGGYFYFKSDKKTSPEFFAVERGDIVQEVNVTGNVKPVKSVDLAFEKAGRIFFVLVQVGDYVGAGQILAQEDKSELNSQLEKAKADLETQKAGLNKSNVALNNYYASIPTILNDAYTKADDAVRKQTGSFFTDGESDTPKLSFSSANSQAVTDAQNNRLVSRVELNNWRDELNKLDAASHKELDLAFSKSKSHLEIIRIFLLNATDALEKSYGLSQSTLDSYKANVITARTNINTALTNINNQAQSINSQIAVVASEEADIKSYEAAIQNIEVQIAKTFLRSPIDGVITKQDARVGEIALAGATLISVISASQFEVETNVPEADIAGIKIGNTADITLDAYGDDIVFKAKVSAIDPAETVIDGVSTYKVKLRFLEGDARIKSGMTANIDILKQEKSGVLIVPQRLVSSRNGKKFVNITENGNKKEIEVVTGLRGSGGNIEIVEGLKEGDHVSY